jgi:predicted lipid-binding transport protein (Tim44 family)
MLLVIIGAYVAIQRGKARSGGWSTSPSAGGTPGRQPAARSGEAIQQRLWEKLLRLRMVGPPGPDGRPVPFDPDFSLVLFEDFLYALYAKAHEARGGGRVDTLSAYLSEQARQALRSQGQPGQVKAVVVGAMHYLSVSDVDRQSTRVSVQVRYEANYTEVSASGAEQSWYVVEDWTLARGTKAKSRPPAQTRVFKCPNCGAPLEAVQGRTCSYCQQQVDTGEFDWLVEGVRVCERERRGPQLTGTTEEQGTNLPTVKQRGVEGRMQALLQEDPSLSWDALTQRVGHIFLELQQAWSQRKWEQARPYVSDNLFQMQLYWMQAYREAGLRNVTEGARITCIELARVVSDKYFHAITVRLHATGLDYTLRDSDGQVVGGSRTRQRRYTEYWTLIRGAGVKGRPSVDKRCPSCGAPLSISMAGQCTHCSAKVTSGEFDWVLSRIEQDESYQG